MESTGIVTVVDCAGYNDVYNTWESVPGFGNDVEFSGLNNDYYGPVLVAVSGGSVDDIKVSGLSTRLVSGIFRLGAGQSMSVSYDGDSPHVVMIGQ